MPVRYIRMAWGGLVANMPNGQAYDDFVRSKGPSRKRKEKRIQKIEDKFDAGGYILVEYLSTISRWVGLFFFGQLILVTKIQTVPNI